MRVLLLACTALICGQTAFALDPSLDISQYGHTAWTVRDGFSLGNIYAMAQAPDGYLWLGTEFGLFRFDGLRSVLWQPPAGQHLPDNGIYSLLVTRDGTLWIGTFFGFATWSGAKLTQRTELDGQFVTSLFEDSEGTVWAGSLGYGATPTGRLCAIRSGKAQCYAENGAFGSSFGLCMRTAQALSGLAQSLDFGDGSPVLQDTTMRRRKCRSVT
jgi:ligand-binding sensor domain-containing protein